MIVAVQLKVNSNERVVLKTLFSCSGVDHWAEHFEKCAGNHQSPIDVRVRRTVFNEKLRDFSIIYTDVSPASVTSEATNNGHSCKAHQF